jgi:hypothetical protein
MATHLSLPLSNHSLNLVFLPLFIQVFLSVIAAHSTLRVALLPQVYDQQSFPISSAINFFNKYISGSLF